MIFICILAALALAGCSSQPHHVPVARSSSSCAARVRLADPSLTAVQVRDICSLEASQANVLACRHYEAQRAFYAAETGALDSPNTPVLADSKKVYYDGTALGVTFSPAP